MHEKAIIVRNKAGIHCRPSSVILLAAQEYPNHDFQIITNNGTCGLQSILDLLSLGIQYGDTVRVVSMGTYNIKNNVNIEQKENYNIEDVNNSIVDVEVKEEKENGFVSFMKWINKYIFFGLFGD